MVSDEKWKEELENTPPYVPKVRKIRKLPKFNPKDMLFKKELKASK